jgi:hypothetical protein
MSVNRTRPDPGGPSTLEAQVAALTAEVADLREMLKQTFCRWVVLEEAERRAAGESRRPRAGRQPGRDRHGLRAVSAGES